MKPIPILFALLWMAFASFGQTYTGTSTDKMGKYNCLFRIGKDNTIDFIYNQNDYVVYAAYSGKMKRLNDTLYRVSAKNWNLTYPSKIMLPGPLETRRCKPGILS